MLDRDLKRRRSQRALRRQGAQILRARACLDEHSDDLHVPLANRLAKRRLTIGRRVGVCTLREHSFDGAGVVLPRGAHQRAAAGGEQEREERGGTDLASHALSRASGEGAR